MAARRSNHIPVTLISDSTGSLGRHVLEAIFTQFPRGVFTLHTLNFVDSEERLDACLAQLEHAQGLIVHATVYEAFKQRIEAACRRHRLPVYDLTGPIAAFFTQASGLAPQVSHRKLHELNQEYFNRVEAIEYAINHDDGTGLKTLHEADVVLTGISRTTKTPTSMVLAMHGLRAANVPLVPAVEPPAELLRLEPSRVICLTADLKQLAAFRSVRVQQQLGFDGGYTDEEAIRTELAWAHRLAATRGWELLDVSARSVEETAARVLQMVIGPRRAGA